MALNGSFMSINSFPSGGTVDRQINRARRESDRASDPQDFARSLLVNENENENEMERNAKVNYRSRGLRDTESISARDHRSYRRAVSKNAARRINRSIRSRLFGRAYRRIPRRILRV